MPDQLEAVLSFFLNLLGSRRSVWSGVGAFEFVTCVRFVLRDERGERGGGGHDGCL